MRKSIETPKRGTVSDKQPQKGVAVAFGKSFEQSKKPNEVVALFENNNLVGVELDGARLRNVRSFKMGAKIGDLSQVTIKIDAKVQVDHQE